MPTEARTDFSYIVSFYAVFLIHKIFTLSMRIISCVSSISMSNICWIVKRFFFFFFFLSSFYAKTRENQKNREIQHGKSLFYRQANRMETNSINQLSSKFRYSIRLNIYRNFHCQCKVAANIYVYI